MEPEVLDINAPAPEEPAASLPNVGATGTPIETPNVGAYGDPEVLDINAPSTYVPESLDINAPSAPSPVNVGAYGTPIETPQDASLDINAAPERPYEPGEIGYSANTIAEKWGEAEDDIKNTNQRISQAWQRGDVATVAQEYAGLQTRNAGRAAMGGLNALQIIAGAPSQLIGAGDQLANEEADRTRQAAIRAGVPEPVANAVTYAGELARKTAGTMIPGLDFIAGAPTLARTGSIQGAVDKFGQALDSDLARDYGSGKFMSSRYDGLVENIPVQVPEWVPGIGGTRTNLPFADVLDLGASLLLDPTNYVGMGAAKGALGGVAKGTGTMGKLASGAIALDEAASLPYKALVGMTGDPKLAGLAGVTGIGLIGISSIADDVTDAAGNPVFVNPLREFTKVLPEEYRESAGLILALGGTMGVAASVGGTNAIMRKVAPAAVKVADGGEFAREVGGRLIRVEGVRQVGTDIVDGLGRVQSDVKVLAPGEKYYAPRDLRSLTAYSEGNQVVNNIDSLVNRVAAALPDNLAAYGNVMNDLFELVADRNNILDPQKLADTANAAARRGGATQDLFSAEAFAGTDTRRALGVLRDAVDDAIKLGKNEKVQIGELLQDIMDKRALNPAEMSKQIIEMGVGRVIRDLKIANPSWTNPVTRYLAFVEQLDSVPVMRDALKAAGMDEKLFLKTEKAFKEIDGNSTPGLLIKGAKYSKAEREAIRILAEAERRWSAVKPDADGFKPRMPDALDPKLRGANINPILDFMMASKVITAPFDLIARPAYHVYNLVGDSVMAGLRGDSRYFQNLFGGRAEKVKTALGVPDASYIGKEGGPAREALGIQQPTERLPAQMGAFRMGASNLPGGRVAAAGARGLQKAGEGVQHLIQKTPIVGQALDEARRREALRIALIERKAEPLYKQRAVENLMRTRGIDEREAWQIAQKDWNDWISGKASDKWDRFVDWSTIPAPMRDIAMEVAARVDNPALFGPEFEKALAANMDQLIDLMDRAPSVSAAALLGAMAPPPPPSGVAMGQATPIQMQHYDAHAALVAPSVQQVQARQLRVVELMDQLPEAFRGNTDGMLRVMNELAANPTTTPRSVMAAWAGPGGAMPARLTPEDIAVLKELRTAVTDYFSAAADAQKHSNTVMASMGISPTSMLPHQTRLSILESIPDPYNPGWVDAAGNAVDPVRTIRQPNGSYLDEAGNPISFTNSMAWAFNGVPPGGHVFRSLKDQYRAAAAKAVSTADIPSGVVNRLDDQARTLLRNEVMSSASRDALSETRATLFGYDDRTYGQYMLDHITPYSYWTMNHMADVGGWLAAHPTQYYTLMLMMRDWAAETKDAPESLRFARYLWTAPDGSEVWIRPGQFFAFAGNGLAEAVDPFSNRESPYAQALISLMRAGGVMPHRPIDLAMQAATTRGAGPLTEWYTGPRDTNRSRTLISQGAIVNRILKSQGIDWDPMALVRSAVYGTTRNGLDDYYTGLELARRVKDGEITNLEARRAILSVRDNTPSEAWLAAERAAMGERARANLISYMGLPSSVMTPERLRIDELTKDYYGITGPDGKLGVQPRADLRLTDPRTQFRKDNPDLAIKEALNDDRRQLVKSIAQDEYSTAYEDMRARQRSEQEALDARAAKGEISGKEWRDLSKELDTKYSDEYKKIDAQFADRNLRGPFKPVGAGVPNRPLGERYRPEDADAVEAFRKAVQGYWDIPYDKEDPSKFYAARDAYIAKLPEDMRERVLAELYKNETAAERFERTVIQPLEAKYRDVPKFVNVSQAQYARYEKAINAYNEGRRNGTPSDGYKAMVKAGLAKTEAEARSLYGEASRAENPARDKLRNSDEFAPYRDFYRIPKTEPNTRTNTSTGGTSSSSFTGTRVNTSEFFAQNKSIRDSGRPQEANYQLALNWDNLKAAGVTLRGDKPNIQEAKLKADREAIYAQMPPKGPARDEWLAKGNGKILNELSARLGEKAIWPELDLKQLAAKRDNDALWDAYYALPVSERSRYLAANRGRLDANNEALKGTEFASKSQPTTSTGGGAPRGGGGGGGGGGSRPSAPRPVDPAVIRHNEGVNISGELGPYLAAVKDWYKTGKALTPELMDVLRRIRTRYPLNMAYGAPESEWLRALVERLQVANPD